MFFWAHPAQKCIMCRQPAWRKLRLGCQQSEQWVNLILRPHNPWKQLNKLGATTKNTCSTVSQKISVRVLSSLISVNWNKITFGYDVIVDVCVCVSNLTFLELVMFGDFSANTFVVANDILTICYRESAKCKRPHKLLANVICLLNVVSL